MCHEIGRIPRLALTCFHLNVMLNVSENLENVETAFLTFTLVIWGNRCMYVKSSPPSSMFSFISKSSYNSKHVHEIWKNPKAHTTLLPLCHVECTCEILRLALHTFSSLLWRTDDDDVQLLLHVSMKCNWQTVGIQSLLLSLWISSGLHFHLHVM